MESKRLKRLAITGIIIVVLMLGVFGTVNFLKTQIKYDYNTVSIRVLETVNYIKTNRMAERITKNFGRSKDELLGLTRFFPYNKSKNWSDYQSDMRCEDKILLKRAEINQDELLGASNLKNWSENQGEMNWKDAKKKCESLGKGWRLPNKEEWQLNYGKNQKLLLKEWSKDGGYHWTSDENCGTHAYIFFVRKGKVGYGVKFDTFYVRCIR